MAETALRDALRSQFLSVFIDGRNEHGSHVLQMPGDRIFDADAMRDLLALLEDQEEGYAEKIITEAEALGHGVGHVVCTMWSGYYDTEFGFEWDYGGISSELTAAMYGSPDEQQAELSEFVSAGGRETQ